jgi:peptide-methionine (S)-S-oxide reductase
LIKERLINQEEGYFKNPYLLYFIADNPVRNDKLPANIPEITRFLIRQAKDNASESFHQQINYTLGLVATGRIAAESGMQIELMDLLMDAGAIPGDGLGALAHGNKAAAAHLVKRGGKISLGAAVGLAYNEDDISKLLTNASEDEKMVALTVAAFYGDDEMISFLLIKGIKPGGYPDNKSGFHSHATPLHQAVYSASLEAIKLLIKAGAMQDVKDKIYGGTPLEWAIHLQKETANEQEKKKYKEIEDYLSVIKS